MDDINSIDSPSARFARLVVATTLVVALAACSHSSSSGKPLPEAKLSNLATGKVADWPADGKPMVVNFWASWCTPCRKEMPAFEQVHQKLGDRVAIVGVTDEDDHAAAKKAAEAAGVTYPVLVDDDQTLLTDLKVSGLPGTVFVDADGKVESVHLGALTEAALTKEIEDRYGITA